MAREVQIVYFCDNEKKHKGADVPAEALPPITLSSAQPRELDLCADCRVELFEPLKALLDNEGRAPDKPHTERASQVTCPHCGRKLASARGLSIHLARSHPEEAEEAPAEFACPTCERSFTTPNALGAHRNRAHGYRAGDDEQ